MTTFYAIVVVTGVFFLLKKARERRTRGRRAADPGQRIRWERPPLGVQLHFARLNQRVANPRPLEFRRRG